MENGMTPLEPQLAYWLSRQTSRTSVRRVAHLGAAVGSDIGLVRTENQDRAVIVQGWESSGTRFSVAIVADGIGGMRGGGACASLAVSGFIASICQSANLHNSSVDWLKNAAIRANNAVYEKFYGDGGSTLVAALIRNGQAPCWVSVGDSRIYVETELKLKKISTDDTIAGQLGKEAIDNPDQGRLLQFIGMGHDLQPHVHELNSAVPGRFVLATDGVHYLSRYSSCMEKVVSIAADPGVCAKRLVDLANWCGGHDNATVALLPTSIPKEPITPPMDGVIEVWDSFGECQFFIGNFSPDFKGYDNSAHDSTNRPTKNLGVPKAATKQRSPGNIKKTRPSKSPPKKGQPPKTTKPNEPQLIMEFPNKRK